MSSTLDDIMERASRSLAAMDYLTCERLCVEALAAARRAQDWSYYARILLPLQEARRQRRLIAADGWVRLGTSDLEGPHHDWSGVFEAGCVAITRPFTASHAAGLVAAMNQQRRCLEVLLIDSDLDADVWRVVSFTGPSVTVDRPAPPALWRDRWLSPRDVREAGEPGPDDWFLDAAEALGDAALAQVDAEPGTVDRLAQLEARLAAAGDHEILHQRLGDAARRLAQA